ncbi:unnamed protein product [Blepharisma stoltei]|uniref:MULE transposase domain-containing protein n=1 Tax=Blepharisma stoltei TaxID=1481888 RepID=A0AAU9IU19_9CILI|nr:unnamed protein product [Blepharisma stoltei]
MVIEEVRELIFTNPSILQSEINVRLEAEFPELYKNFTSIKISKIFQNIKKEAGLNDWRLAPDILSSIQSQGISFFRSSSINYSGDLYHYIIWATKWQLSHLRESVHWYMDGTFKVIPAGFYQLLTILIIDPQSQHYMPTCFIAMSSKHTFLYQAVFEKIKLITQVNSLKLKVESFTINFEKSLMLAVKNCFPGKKIVGCLFHFSQSLNREGKKIIITA